MASTRNILVINDEAHHAWRIPAESKIKGVKKEDIEEATKWVGGLDRIHRARGILNCYDFSATPFAPSGKQSSDEALFDWIVSDFGLNDAIESGLVKTPRVVVRDDGVPDAKTYKSKLYHIYEHVKDDLNRRAEEQVPLPDLVTTGYYLLGKDWLEAAREWKAKGCDASRDDHGRKPNGNRRAGKVRVRSQKDLARRALRSGADTAHRLQSARHGGGPGRAGCA